MFAGIEKYRVSVPESNGGHEARSISAQSFRTKPAHEQSFRWQLQMTYMILSSNAVLAHAASPSRLHSDTVSRLHVLYLPPSWDTMMLVGKSFVEKMHHTHSCVRCPPIRVRESDGGKLSLLCQLRPYVRTDHRILDGIVEDTALHEKMHI
jgi:hypothetical protein